METIWDVSNVTQPNLNETKSKKILNITISMRYCSMTLSPGLILRQEGKIQESLEQFQVWSMDLDLDPKLDISRFATSSTQAARITSSRWPGHSSYWEDIN